MKNKKVYFYLIFLLFTIFLFALSTISFAADPKLITNLNKALTQIESWILKLATPAAAVAVRYWCFYEEIQFW